MTKRSFLALMSVGLACAFAPSSPAAPRPLAHPRTSSQSQLDAAVPPLDPAMVTEINTARAAFGLCFFGALGTAALGRSALPIVYRKFMLTQSLKGQGPSLGGEKLGLSPVTGYPEDVRIADVQSILHSNLTASDIVKQYPGAMPGYLTYESFAAANADSNPLAARAVFESLAVTSDIVTPNTAQRAMETYKTDLNLLKENLKKTKALNFSAAIILCVLLGLADYFTLYHLWKGWFPEWPGLDYFPSLLFDKDVGLLAIPKYWIGEV